MRQEKTSRESMPRGLVRQYYLKLGDGSWRGSEFRPYYYLEAKIDLADVRSGIGESLSVNRALEIIPIEGDVLWTEDMVRPIDPAMVESRPPEDPLVRPLPPFIDAERLRWVENQFISYLLRYFELRIFRNPALNAYSCPGEPLEDFRERCRDALQESFRIELDGLREVFGRKLEQLKQKYLPGDRWGDLAEDPSTSLSRSRLHESAERLAELFLRADLEGGVRKSGHSAGGEAHDELAERLDALYAEACATVQKAALEYAERADTADDYVIRPTLRGIRMGGVSILWMPVEMEI